MVAHATVPVTSMQAETWLFTVSHTQSVTMPATLDVQIPLSNLLLGSRSSLPSPTDSPVIIPAVIPALVSVPSAKPPRSKKSKNTGRVAKANAVEEVTGVPVRAMCSKAKPNRQA